MKYEQTISLFPLQTVHLSSHHAPFSIPHHFFLMTRYVQLLLPTGIHVSPANGAWKTYKKPHPQKGMNRLPSATINCQQFLSPGWGLEIVYPIYTGMLDVLNSCWFCARNHSCCGFEHNGHILSRRRQPTGLLPIPCFLPSFRLLFSKALWALVMMGNNVEIWLGMDNWSLILSTLFDDASREFFWWLVPSRWRADYAYPHTWVINI